MAKTASTGKAVLPDGILSYLSFPRTNNAIPELDGLRAIAVLLVLARHAVWPLFQGETGRIETSAYNVIVPMSNGWIGVDLFFVLSGFLITHHLLRRDTATPLANFRRYLGARALRIVPAYLAVMFLVVAGAIPLYQVTPEFLFVRVAYHLLFFQDYLPANIVVAFWSLGVEEKFYLLAPVVLLLAVSIASRLGRYGFLAGLVLLPMTLRAITDLWHPEISTYADYFPVFRSPFHLTFDGLAVGVFCAFISRDQREAAKARLWPHFLFWAATAFFAFQLFGWELLGRVGSYEKLVQPLVLSITFGGMLLASVLGGAPKSILGSRILLIVARVSYPLYLIHIPLVPLALALSGYQVGQDVGEFLKFFAGFLTLSLLAAFLLHFLVEKPFLLLKDRTTQSRPSEGGVEQTFPARDWRSDPLVIARSVRR